MLRPETIVSLLSLTALETVLGIDNIIFLTILVGKLPLPQQAIARRLGLVLALGMRILLLLTLSWLASLRHPWFWFFGRGISGRDLVLIVGGGFLLFKSARELYEVVEGEPEEAFDDATTSERQSQQKRALTLILVQIVLMDIVFSLDSVITAVGLAPHVGIMITAMILSMLIMLAFAKPIGDFVARHPSMKVLALGFLVLVGVLLLAEGWGQKLEKGPIYFAMVFSFVVQLLNIRMHRRSGGNPPPEASSNSLRKWPMPVQTHRLPLDSASPLEVQGKLLEVHQRLCQTYGCPIPYFHELDPLSELVSSLLSHRTRNADSGQAFKMLRAHFATWEAVRDAPVAEVQQAIAAVTWPEQKAPRLQLVLRAITEQRGELSLDFLADLPVNEARGWLARLPGVGPKTSAAVLLFSRLHLRALPVDSHHHRVAVRLGLLPSNVAVGPAHALLEGMLPDAWDAQHVYDHHEVLMLHGQRCCFFRNPACERCPVLDLCPTGIARQGGT